MQYRWSVWGGGGLHGNINPITSRSIAGATVISNYPCILGGEGVLGG